MLIGFFFISLGLLIKFGKAYGLIAGYNTMSAKEKANYNIKKAANLFMFVMLYMGSLMILGELLTEWTKNETLKNILFWGALVTGLPFLIWKSNTKAHKIDNSN